MILWQKFHEAPNYAIEWQNLTLTLSPLPEALARRFALRVEAAAQEQ